MKVKLRKPPVVDDKTIDELEIDTGKITGADIMFCVHEAAAQGGVIINHRIDMEVHLQMACKLTGLARAQLLELDGRDFNKVLAPVQDFFLSSD